MIRLPASLKKNALNVWKCPAAKAFLDMEVNNVPLREQDISLQACQRSKTLQARGLGKLVLEGLHNRRLQLQGNFPFLTQLRVERRPLGWEEEPQAKGAEEGLAREAEAQSTWRGVPATSAPAAGGNGEVPRQQVLEELKERAQKEKGCKRGLGAPLPKKSASCATRGVTADAK